MTNAWKDDSWGGNTAKFETTDEWNEGVTSPGDEFAQNNEENGVSDGSCFNCGQGNVCLLDFLSDAS